MTATFPTQAQRFSRSDYKTLGLAALGGALEIYDFIIFVFFALTLSQLFFPPEMPEWLRLLQSFGIFVTGYLARPLGGILMAHFADHHEGHLHGERNQAPEPITKGLGPRSARRPCPGSPRRR